MFQHIFSIKYFSILLFKSKGHRSISIVANDLFPNENLKLLICSSFNNKLTISFQFRVKNEASSSFHAVLICQHKPFFQWSFTWNDNDNKIAFQYDAYRPLVDCISQHALCRGVSARGGWYPSMHRGRPPPCTEFLTHATENITFPETSFVGGNDVVLVCYMHRRLRYQFLIMSLLS